MRHRLSTTKARAQFADILNDVAFKGERVVLHRHGKDIAAVVSAADLALLEAMEDRLDLAAIRAALRSGEPLVPWAELKTEAGL
jgi:prevent-host-death family protein